MTMKSVESVNQFTSSHFTYNGRGIRIFSSQMVELVVALNLLNDCQFFDTQPGITHQRSRSLLTINAVWFSHTQFWISCEQSRERCTSCHIHTNYSMQLQKSKTNWYNIVECLPFKLIPLFICDFCFFTTVKKFLDDAVNECL